MEYVLWGLVAIVVVGFVLTAAGVAFQGTRLDRWIDSVRDGAMDRIAEVEGTTQEAIDGVRDEVAKLWRDVETRIGEHPAHLTDGVDTASLTAIDQRLSSANNALIEEKAIRARETQHLGAALDELNEQLHAIRTELHNKPDTATVNAVLAASKEKTTS